MNPKEYEKNVLVTESCDLDSIKNRVDQKMVRLLHAGLGLSSELNELVSASSLSLEGGIDWWNVMEESGDLLWYVAVAVNTLGFDHDEISSFESENEINYATLSEKSLASLQDCLNTAVWAVGGYNDLLKKHLFYGKELNLEKVKESLQQVCIAVSGMCSVSGTTIADARRINIDKLKARYGQKFTEAAALNRDLETERKILEGSTQ